MKNKKVTTFFVGLLMFFLLGTKVSAQDITITCENDGTSTVSPDPMVELFDESLAPGESVQKTIEIINNDVNDLCDVSFDISSVGVDESNISEKYFTSIQINGVDVFGNRVGSEADSTSSLSDLFSAGILDFASVSVGNTATIDWVVTFDPSSGNEYQGKALSFDFVLSMQWGSAQDGVEGGAVLGESTTSGLGEVLGATGEGILLPVLVGLVILVAVVILYKNFKKKNK